MTVATFLYQLFIRPLELLFEVLYYNANKLFHHPGISIIVMSLVVNLLALPLYRRADKQQEENKKTEEKLKDGIRHIKKTFRGNERFFMLQTYYRQNGYSPVYALRGALPLMLEIPFFLAAYHFLSNLHSLKGVSLGPIADLGTQDALVSVGAVTINILPILMTVINLISGMIYAEKMTRGGKTQLVVIALVFLVLLYRSPSGLVFYWTLNNLFSLCKNLFYKLKKPGQALAVLFFFLGSFIVLVSLLQPGFSAKRKLVLALFGAALMVPLVICRFGKRRLPTLRETQITRNSVSEGKIFFLSGLFLTLLLGVLIPGNVVASSVSEFVDVNMPHSPGSYVWRTAVVSAGYFVVWFGVFFLLADVGGRKLMTMGSVCLSVICIADYMVFHRRRGTLSELLQFERDLVYSGRDYAANCVVIVLLIIGCCLMLKWNKKLTATLLLAGVIAMGFLGVRNAVKIHRDYNMTKERLSLTENTPTLPFSKTGKNVVVLMIDSLASYYVPYMFTEKPELLEEFDGFVFYPNTISFGCQTNFGSPGLYGGYEYTPKEMNKRDRELLVDKQNEALKVMPAVFYANDYKVTVCDPTYAGYNDVPDLSIYDDYPGIETYITMGRVGQSKAAIKRIEETRNRNFFLYSVFEVCPALFQLSIYDGGNYCSTESGYIEENGEIVAGGQAVETLSVSTGVNAGFMKQYNVLNNLSGISEMVADESNHFIMMSNSLPHNPMLVQEPEYEPSFYVDNTEYDEAHRIKDRGDGTYADFYDSNNYPRYQANMTSMLKLGEWFNYLKKNGVWDNTRIIIVSDHAWRLGNIASMKKEYGFEVDRNIPGQETVADFSVFNCSLLVKDFNATGFAVEEDFMTNADVPTLAFYELIDHPVNPFTGKTIDSSYKQKSKLELIMGANFSVYTNNGYTFQPDHWFSVHDNIFDLNNWEYLGYH